MEGPSIVIATEELSKFYKKKPLKVEAASEVLLEAVKDKKFL